MQKSLSQLNTSEKRMKSSQFKAIKFIFNFSDKIDFKYSVQVKVTLTSLECLLSIEKFVDSTYISH